MNPTQKRRRQRQSGFTLVEIMVVVVIIGLLATIVAPNVLGMFGDSQLEKAKTDVKTIHDSATYWKMRKGKIPTMEDLTTPDEKGNIAFQALSQDPWNQDYIIKELDGRKFEVISCGPDEEEGTEDDIRYPPAGDDQ